LVEFPFQWLVFLLSSLNDFPRLTSRQGVSSSQKLSAMTK
jgi:hypothetical protein